MNILILGVDGFIGHALTRRILATTDWKVFGMDLHSSRLGDLVDSPAFRYIEGDISINLEWIEYHVKKCDVVLPLVAIATPATYVKDPLAVFELDFEQNLRVVRQCVKYGKRVLFPSTSEVYGMCRDDVFDEDESTLVYGPIGKQRWIYACSKQLLDRVIAAYGQQRGLRYTCFRPFNWIGPGLDAIDIAKEGSSRVVTQFIADLMEGRPIQLVDGGSQKRCFTWIDDGIEALMTMIENRDGACDGEIFNVGNPNNECSIKDLAEKLAATYVDLRKGAADFTPPRIVEVGAGKFYGKGYQDIVHRTPSIAKAGRLLGWSPKTGLDEALRRTFEAFMQEWDARPASTGAAR